MNRIIAMSKGIKLNKRTVVYSLIVVTILFLSVGFSAFQNNLQIEDLAASVRIEKDIRIAKVSVSSSNNAVSHYEDYNVSNITSRVTLPNIDSYIIYDIDVYNLGNTIMGIKDITTNNQNLKFEILNYNLKEKLCDDNSCNLGMKKTLKLKVSYNDNTYNSENTTFDIRCDFNFKQIYSITYNDIDNSNLLPQYTIEGDTISLNVTKPTGREFYILENNKEISSNKYSYSNNILTITNIEGDLSITLKSSGITDRFGIFEMSDAVNGIKVKSYGNGLYEINGTSTDQVNIRLTDYFVAGTEGKFISNASYPNEKLLFEKGKSYKIEVEYISGTNNVSEFNNFRVCFINVGGNLGIQSFGYDFVTGEFGSPKLIQDIGMSMIWINKGYTFDNYKFRLNIYEIDDTDDNIGNISDIKTFAKNGTNMTVVWYDTGIIEVFGVNDNKVQTFTVHVDLEDHKMADSLEGLYKETYLTNPIYKTGDKVRHTYQFLKNDPGIDSTKDYKYQLYFELRDTSSSGITLRAPSISSEKYDLASPTALIEEGEVTTDIGAPVLIIGNHVNIQHPWRFTYKTEKVN